MAKKLIQMNTSADKRTWEELNENYIFPIIFELGKNEKVPNVKFNIPKFLDCVTTVISPDNKKLAVEMLREFIQTDTDNDVKFFCKETLTSSFYNPGDLPEDL